MEDLYRSVRELPEPCLEYLSWVLSDDGSEWYADLSDEDKAIVDGCEYRADVPHDVLFRAFDGISFVPEDFWCDAGDDWDYWAKMA